jgi:hypothetical protein
MPTVETQLWSESLTTLTLFYIAISTLRKFKRTKILTKLNIQAQAKKAKRLGGHSSMEDFKHVITTKLTSISVNLMMRENNGSNLFQLVRFL